MYQREDDTSSDMTSDDDMTPNGGETPTPPPVHSLSSDQDPGQSRGWAWRGRSRALEPRGRWSYSRSPRSRLPPRDLSLPVMANTSFEMDRDDDRDTVDCESRPQDPGSYQNAMGLDEDRNPQNPIQDNMENYRKLLSLGVQLAEDDRHSHMTQGHSSRAKRGAYPSTSRGLKTVPESRKSAQRRGICEERSSQGVMMENLVKDVSHGFRAGRVRESSERPQNFPRVLSDSWPDPSCSTRESVIQERGFEGNSFRGGFRFTSNLVSRRRVPERKRHYHCDTDGKDLGNDHGGCAQKKPSECGGGMRNAASASNPGSLGSPSAESQPVDGGAMPYLCEECGRSFGVVSEFVEHQIMHTRENLYEYGESFLHSVAVSEVQKSGGKRFECKDCGETFGKSAALAEHRKIHAREHLEERKGRDDEGTEMPSPTFSELQKMYGKDKFYECRICKETFLHSSALIEHQKIHGRGSFLGDRDSERWREYGREREHQRQESFMPGPALHGFQKMYGKEKIHECQVCGEAFLYSSFLKEHQKIHMRGSPFENQNRVCEETFVPGQSLRRWQESYTKEKLFEFPYGREALLQSSDLSEHQKIHSRKNFFAARGYEKPAFHRVPFPSSQKSHTISRPPEDEAGEKAFTISTNPDGDQRFPMAENALEGKPYEKSILHSLALAEAQKHYSAVGLRKPKLVAESPVQSADVINCQKDYSGGDAWEGKAYKRPLTHSLAAPIPLKRRRGSEQAECEEKGESSVYFSELHNKQWKIPTRESPYEEGKNNSYKDTIIQSMPHTEPQRSLAGGGAGEFKQDDKFIVPSSNVREHQKARAKKKYLEPKSKEASVIHSLLLGELQTVCPREKLCACPECGESFACSSDLTEHQKMHNREKLPGSRNYERPLIHSFTPTDPQTSYAQEQYAEEQAHGRPWELGQCSAAGSSLGALQTADGREEPHGEELPGQEDIRGVASRALELGEPRKDEPEGITCERPDCGLGFADLSDLMGHQDIHSRKHLDNGCEYTCSEVHAHSVRESEKTCSGSGSGEQLCKCSGCRESFTHSSLLLQHQRIHEQDQLCSMKGCDDGFVSLLPAKPQRNRAADGNPAVEGLAFRCHQCGQGFAHSSALNVHMRHHRDAALLEQRGRAEDMFLQGLALAEFQGSETGEKLLECTICGECFFTAKELGDHHTKVHKDEPYEQGSYTHASFLTKPLRKPVSFFECKDCGQSFVPGTHIPQHQAFYPEQEAATAQEVEANILIPQEALRIQGSNAEAAEPEAQVAEPEAEAAEPSGEAAEPNGEAAEPNGEAGVEQPSGDADELDGAGIEDPEESAEEPGGDADEPDGAGIEDPEGESEDPEIQVGGSYYSCHECTETFMSSTAFGEHLQTHASMIILEPENALGGCSGYIERAGSSVATQQASEKFFKCEVCGQLFSDLLSLARHQNSHAG